MTPFLLFLNKTELFVNCQFVLGNLVSYFIMENCVCITALLSRVQEEDQKLLKALIPKVRSLAQHCDKGLSYGVQVKTAISYW